MCALLHASLSVVPEPQTVICDELFVWPFVLDFLNRGDGSLDATPVLMAAHGQAIDCEIRTLLEREKTLDRDDTVQVFYRCVEREDQMGGQIGMIVA
jgi:hypothetical protein